MQTLLGSNMDFAEQISKRGLSQPWKEPFWQGWDHQLVARDEAIKAKRFILSMDKGTGKTSTILSIFEDPQVNKDIKGFTVLVFTTEKGMSAYVRDIKKFPEFDGKVTLIYGNKAERTKRWHDAGSRLHTRYIVLTYAGFLSDTGFRGSKSEGTLSVASIPKWVTNGSVDAVVCDEFHRVFRSHKSKTFELFCKMFKNTQYFIPMSGSAVDKGPQDLWPALHLVDPKFFSSYWKYVNAYCDVEDGPYGKVIIGPRNIDAWRRVVRPYVFHVTCEMVNDMPPIFRDTLDVNLPPWQLKLHNDLRDQMYHEVQGTKDPQTGSAGNLDEDGSNGLTVGTVADEDNEVDIDKFIFAQNPLVKIYKMRLANICPRVLSPKYDHGQAIEDIFDDAQNSGLSKYAIFTPFKKPIPFLVQYLTDRGARVWVLQGGISLTEQDKWLDEWRAYQSTADMDRPAIILSTIKYGESWEIPEARCAYMLGYEFSKEDNKQAEARLRRLISVGTTYIRYVKCLTTYDEELLGRLILHGENHTKLFKPWTIGSLMRTFAGLQVTTTDT